MARMRLDFLVAWPHISDLALTLICQSPGVDDHYLPASGYRASKKMSAEGEVLQALQLACSQDPNVLKVGEKQLNSWKTEKNFYATLAVRECTHNFTSSPNV